MRVFASGALLALESVATLTVDLRFLLIATAATAAVRLIWNFARRVHFEDMRALERSRISLPAG